MSDRGDASRSRRLQAARLYLIVTVRGDEEWIAPLEAALSSACIDAVQLRCPRAADVRIVERAHVARDLAHAHGALFVLNDRPDLAARVEADGVHVGQADAAPLEARRAVGADRIVGLSTHDVAEIHGARAAPVDYVGLGPMFPTASKTLAREPGGAALLARCLPAAGTLPVFPIGGIAGANAHSLVAAGARRLAVGAGILAHDDPAAAARHLAALLTG